MNITPVLYMADGTEYDLPSVFVATSGVASVDVNSALTQAPENVRAHLSTFGSAAIKYSYPTTGHVMASMSVLDVIRSLTFVFPFVEPGAMQAMPDHSTHQTLEGLWWKHDPGVNGFISFTNTTDKLQSATLQLLNAGGALSGTQSVQMNPHTAQVLLLNDLLAAAGVNDSTGGLRIKYEAEPGSVVIEAGLVNEKEGYSANLPLWPRDENAKSQAITYASAGLMVGKPMPVSGFPDGVTFTPYLVLRNTSANPLALTLHVNTGIPKTTEVPLQLAPGESRNVEVSAIMQQLGISQLNGAINLAVSFNAKPADLIMATGSVDQSGTFVFEVNPQGTGSSEMKIGEYWSVANGNDSMITLWNTTNAPEDLLLRFYFANGSDQYTLAVHLDAQQSIEVDMLELIGSGRPDKEGNLFPIGVEQGSFSVSAAAGKEERIGVVISAGVFNVSTGTCSYVCVTCCGRSNFVTLPGNFACPVGDTHQFTPQATSCDGTIIVLTASSWSSSNTAYGTVNSSGMMSAIAPGSLNIKPFLQGQPVYTGTICGPAAACPESDIQPAASGVVTPSITSISPSSALVGARNVQITINGTGFGTAPSVTLPAGFTSSGQGSTDTQIVVTVDIDVNTSIGTKSIGVTVNSQHSNTVNFIADGPHHMIGFGRPGGAVLWLHNNDF